MHIRSLKSESLTPHSSRVKKPKSYGLDKEATDAKRSPRYLGYIQDRLVSLARPRPGLLGRDTAGAGEPIVGRSPPEVPIPALPPPSSARIRSASATASSISSAARISTCVAPNGWRKRENLKMKVWVPVII